jgi:hypothetical protein
MEGDAFWAIANAPHKAINPAHAKAWGINLLNIGRFIVYFSCA